MPIAVASQIQIAPEANQFFIEAQQRSVRFPLFQKMLQLRPAKGTLILGIGHSTFPAKRREFFPAPATHRFHEAGIEMAREVLKRRRLTVLLPHEQQGHEGGEQCGAGRELLRFEINQCAQPLSRGPIAHLIMILTAYHEV